jgi:hypothetical protein
MSIRSKGYCSIYKGKYHGILLHHTFLVDFPSDVFFPHTGHGIGGSD